MGNIDKSIFILGKTGELLSKARRSCRAAAQGLEGTEGDAETICAVWRDRSQTWPSRIGGFRFLHECEV